MTLPERSPPRTPASHFRSLSDPQTARLFLQNVGEGVYVSDAQGYILDANPAFLEIFGVKSVEELQQFSIDDLLTNPEKRHTEMEVLARDGHARAFELKIVRPDGGRRTVRDTTYLVK